MNTILNNLYPNRISIPNNVDDIEKENYVVYILTYNNTPIVVGHGKRNRARVIFDDLNQITQGHIKSLFVRIYQLYGTKTFNRFIIACTSKKEAQLIEKKLHIEIGGNSNLIDNQLLENLFSGFDIESKEWLFLKLALLSSFDGLSDLKKWRRNKIISNDIWDIISNRLRLTYL